jgi:hypothetical protein
MFRLIVPFYLTIAGGLVPLMKVAACPSYLMEALQREIS